MNLFQLGIFKLHGGGSSNFKVECDALTDADLRALTWALVRKLEPFGDVVGVPRGGLRLADIIGESMIEQRMDRPLLVVDDVLTTGASMEETRTHSGHLWPGRVVGAVLFARGPCPDWVTPLWRGDIP